MHIAPPLRRRLIACPGRPAWAPPIGAPTTIKWPAMALLASTRPARATRVGARRGVAFSARARTDITPKADPVPRADVGAPPLPTATKRSRACRRERRACAALQPARPRPVAKRDARPALLTANQVRGAPRERGPVGDIGSLRARRPRAAVAPDGADGVPIGARGVGPVAPSRADEEGLAILAGAPRDASGIATLRVVKKPRAPPPQLREAKPEVA